MKRIALVLMAVGLVYCGDATGPGYDVAFGIVSGDGQQVQAGSDSLTAPVIGQAYRDESGNVAFRMIGAAPLHAQTPIGTGVADVLTCAEPVGATGLQPYLRCRQTDSQGMVTYWFEPGTVATDSACAEIRAEVDGQPQALAVTCSQVLAGPAVSGLGFGFAEGGIGVAGSDTLRAPTDPVDEYGNVVGWRFEVASGPAHVPAGMPQVLVADSLGTGEAHVITEHSDTSFADLTVEMVNGVQEIHLMWRR